MGGDPALLDTGVLVAFLHRDDRDHEAATVALANHRGALLTTEAVLTESAYLLSRTIGGAAACIEFFVRGGATLVPASRRSLVRCREILDSYSDLPADFADATLVALGEELEILTIYSLDRRGFSIYRTSDGRAFDVWP